MSRPPIRTLLQQALTAWRDDHASSLGAAIAYYALFSLAPLLLIIVSIAGLAFGREAAEGRVVAELSGLMGIDSAAALQALLRSVSRPEQGAFGTIVGTLLLVVGATGVLSELQDALDRIWQAPERPVGSGLMQLLRGRVAALGMIMAVGFLLVVSLALSAAISALTQWSGQEPTGYGLLLEVVNFALSFGFVSVAFAVLYKVMPRARIAWHDVWVGATFTALLFTAGKFLIGYYIGRAGVASGFGAAGSVIVLLVWMYYSAQLFLLGAEFTWVYAHACGSRQHLKAETSAAPIEPVVEPTELLSESRQRLRDALEPARRR
ncbi:YihY/virulence factor BrkB family protein [Piscinibacter koreensis]|uniref:YihY/virulence factor BrkB family protein n=1 Tax=Piscinibacter koreensis TaxID=2742824 RepID=A0A7Y6TVZ9_9BURK|nr:YihY/virulence factor BrkB family protein [Schlegelella koreensis]NUZ05492.1 YihY/virulence factor BrkB family protein [Schlegelella koreensis]